MRTRGTVSCYVTGCGHPECQEARREYDRRRQTAGHVSKHRQRGPRAKDGGVSALTLRVAELRYEYGFSLKELVAEVGLNRSAVRYHLNRHLQRTRAMLGSTHG